MCPQSRRVFVFSFFHVSCFEHSADVMELVWWIVGLWLCCVFYCLRSSVNKFSHLSCSSYMNIVFLVWHYSENSVLFFKVIDSPYLVLFLPPCSFFVGNEDKGWFFTRCVWSWLVLFSSCVILLRFGSPGFHPTKNLLCLCLHNGWSNSYEIGGQIMMVATWNVWK